MLSVQIPVHNLGNRKNMKCLINSNSLERMCANFRAKMHVLLSKGKLKMRPMESTHTHTHTHTHTQIYIYNFQNEKDRRCSSKYFYKKKSNIKTTANVLSVFCKIKDSPIDIVSKVKAPFSIATTPRCRRGRYSIPWIAQLCPWSVPYNAEC